MVVSMTVQVVQHLARQWAAAKRQTSVAGQVPFPGLIRRLRKHIWWMDSRRNVPKGSVCICISLGKLAFSNNFHKLMMGQLSLGRREINQTWSTTVAFDLPSAANLTGDVYFQALPPIHFERLITRVRGFRIGQIPR